MKMTMDKVVVDKQEIYLRKCTYIMNQEMKNVLDQLGLEAWFYAYHKPQETSFFNHTGNLRSSIGYGVYRDGKKVAKGGFELTPSPDDTGHLGQWHGRRELTRVEQETSTIASVSFKMGASHIKLVMVAGMPYAADVEAKDNKDVLASARLMTENKVKPYLLEAKRRIQERIKKIKV